MDDSGAITPLIYRHTGLTDGVPRFTASTPKGKPVYYPAGPSGDVDGDGRLDLFLINWFTGNHSRLLRNESAAQNQWLNVRVVGKRMNRMGIGAQIHIYATGKLGDAGALLGFQEITTGYGYASGQPAIAHFGLGTTNKVDVRITLPSRTTIDRRDIPSNQLLSIPEE
jgi:enediyne biosynthesis protein E4